MGRPHVQVVFSDSHIPASVRRAIQHSGATASYWPLARAIHSGPLAEADAVVLLAPAAGSGATSRIRALLNQLAEAPRPVLITRPGNGPLPRFSHPQSVPVIFCGSADERELSIRLSTLLATRTSLDVLHRGLEAQRDAERSAARRFRHQLRLASRVQREFLPQEAPQAGPVSFRTLFRPMDYVSGDLFDINYLDAEHIGIAVADAAGHGLPAALLTVYLKRALRGTELRDGRATVLSPQEVLQRLNDDLMHAELAECRFVAATYAVLNTRTLELRLARAGAPYPLIRRAAGEVEVIRTDGSVLGAMPEAIFEVRSVQLLPGDALLLYSDGLERVVIPGAGAPHSDRSFGTPGCGESFDEETGGFISPDPYLPQATMRLDATAGCGGFTDGGADLQIESDGGVALAEAVHERVHPGEFPLARTAWFEVLATEGALVALDRAAVRCDSLRRMRQPLDDLTLVCLTVADG